MISLKRVTPADRETLWNIFQKYLYELSAFYDMDMDGKGNFTYRHFDDYFIENEREAYFVLSDGALAGFAMINGHSCLGEDIDYAMAEFTIFPAFRGKGCGAEAVRQIFAGHRGRWEIKFSGRNMPAKALWTKAAAPFAPRVSSFEGTETVLSFVVAQTGWLA